MKRVLGMCLLGVLAGVLVAGPALAQYTGGSPPNLPAAEPGSGAAGPRPGTGTGGTGPGTGTGGTGTGTVEVRTPQAPVRSLVLTGADIATMSAAALTAVILGTVLVRRSRQTHGERRSG